MPSNNKILPGNLPESSDGYIPEGRHRREKPKNIRRKPTTVTTIVNLSEGKRVKRPVSLPDTSKLFRGETA